MMCLSQNNTCKAKNIIAFKLPLFIQSTGKSMEVMSYSNQAKDTVPKLFTACYYNVKSQISKKSLMTM